MISYDFIAIPFQGYAVLVPVSVWYPLACSCDHLSCTRAFFFYLCWVVLLRMSLARVSIWSKEKLNEENVQLFERIPNDTTIKELFSHNSVIFLHDSVPSTFILGCLSVFIRSFQLAMKMALSKWFVLCDLVRVCVASNVGCGIILPRSSMFKIMLPCSYAYVVKSFTPFSRFIGAFIRSRAYFRSGAIIGKNFAFQHGSSLTTKTAQSSSKHCNSSLARLHN